MSYCHTANNLLAQSCLKFLLGLLLSKCYKHQIKSITWIHKKQPRQVSVDNPVNFTGILFDEIITEIMKQTVLLILYTKLWKIWLAKEGKMNVTSKKKTTRKWWGISLWEVSIWRNSLSASIKMKVNKTLVMYSKRKKKRQKPWNCCIHPMRHSVKIPLLTPNKAVMVV